MITIFIAVVFIVFEIVVNVDYFLNLFLEREKQETLMEQEELKELVFSEDGTTTITQEVDYLLYFDSSDLDLEEKSKNVLKNQKRGFESVESISGLSQEENKTLILIQSELDEQETDELIRFVEAGNHIFFLKLPDDASMKQEQVQQLLGVHRYMGATSHEGIRFVPNFFVTDELLEVKNVDVSMYECELMQKTRTFAYTLVAEEKLYEEVDNEELPPIVWRNNSLGGSVYVMNANFNELGCSQGVFTALFALLEEDDIYPVINGYSVMVSGLPYVRNGVDKRLEELYSRDAMGIQQDIVFPTLISNIKKLQYQATVFAKLGEVDSIDNDYLEAQFSYMQKEIKGTSGEIGVYYEGNIPTQDLLSTEKILFDSGETEIPNSILESMNTVVSMEADDSNYINRVSKNVVLPVVRKDVYNEDEERLHEISYATECAFVSVLIDVDLMFENEDTKYNWENYSKQFDSVISGHRKYYGTLDRLTVNNVASRVLEYTVMQPNITKTDDNIKVEMEQFTGEAYFILRTEKEIVETKSCSYVRMGENAYLIHATESEIEIELKKEMGV